MYITPRLLTSSFTIPHPAIMRCLFYNDNKVIEGEVNSGAWKQPPVTEPKIARSVE